VGEPRLAASLVLALLIPADLASVMNGTPLDALRFVRRRTKVGSQRSVNREVRSPPGEGVRRTKRESVDEAPETASLGGPVRVN
jgi:hypothetical protein